MLLPTSEPFPVPWCCWLWRDPIQGWHTPAQVIQMPFMLHFSASYCWCCASFVGFISDIGVPMEVRGDLDSKVFCLRFCAKGVTVELVLWWENHAMLDDVHCSASLGWKDIFQHCSLSARLLRSCCRSCWSCGSVTAFILCLFWPLFRKKHEESFSVFTVLVCACCKAVIMNT